MHAFPYKVTIEEILRGKLYEMQKPDVKLNLKMLLFRINYIRSLYNKPFVVTSGLRSKEDQHKINPKAPNSCHVLGAAVDISDPDGELFYWAKTNESILIDTGIWCENRVGNWLHCQIYPPKSGSRFFNP